MKQQQRQKASVRERQRMSLISGREREREGGRGRGRERERERGRETERERGWETDRDRDRDRQTDKERDSKRGKGRNPVHHKFLINNHTTMQASYTIWYWTFNTASSNTCRMQLEESNNNNNHIQRRYSRFFTISSQRREPSPTRTLKWPGRNRVQITCNTSSAYHVQVSCYMPLGMKGQLSY